jgi:carbamoyltransferase
MGLASYGVPRFQSEFDSFCRVRDDGAIDIEPRYFSYQRHPTRGFTRDLERLLGPARPSTRALDMPHGTADDQRWADVAATLQRVTERTMVAVCRHAKELTGESRLCLAGGVALNSVANRRIADSRIFDSMFVQPAPGDAGGALGAALYVSHVLGSVPRQAFSHAFLGQGYSPEGIRTFLNDCGVRYRRYEGEGPLLADVADRLVKGDVGGWFHGRFEWGPRALGARSILADPRNAGMAERVNRKVKYREAFRPFAPAVCAEDASRWFDVPAEDLLSPYMLSVAPVTSEGRARLPAITHVDGTARLQTVQREDNPRFHGLLEAFRERTGIGVLLNTSMNLKDEPMCASPAEAYGVFLRSAIDFLVLEDCVISKEGNHHGCA